MVQGETITVSFFVCVWNNVWITIQNKPINWVELANKGIHHISDLIDKNKIVGFNELKNKYNITDKEI